MPVSHDAGVNIGQAQICHIQAEVISPTTKNQREGKLQFAHYWSSIITSVLQDSKSCIITALDGTICRSARFHLKP